MDRHLAMMRLPQQLSAFVLSVLALALAAVDLYGVVSYGVALRTHEIGIRMALGTHGPRVLRQLVAGGPKLPLIGRAGAPDTRPRPASGRRPTSSSRRFQAVPEHRYRGPRRPA